MGSVDVRSIADEELLDADANILDDNILFMYVFDE